MGYHSVKHILNKEHNISFDTYYEMLPYELEAELIMIQNDQKEEQDRLMNS